MSTARLRSKTCAIFFAGLLAAGPLRADPAAAPEVVGGTTISGGIADSQSQLDQALQTDPDSASDSLSQYESAYRASGGGPTLAFLGFNPFQIVATGAFHELYWSGIVILLGITTVIAMQQSLVGKQTLRGRHPLAALIQVYFRLLAGVLIIANTPLIYGLLMTVNSSLSQGIDAMSSQSRSQLLQTGGVGTLSLAQARMGAIQNAAARRAVALYPAGASRDEMLQIGAWYEAVASAINSALSGLNMPGQLPRLAAGWNDAQTPDDRLASTVGRTVVQNFSQMAADLGALPRNSEPLSLAFPASGSTSLPPLSSALAEDDDEAALSLSLPDTPASDAAFESARQLYAQKVMADTLSYLDGDLLAVVGASPTLADRVEGWFSEKVEQAAAGAGGWMTQWRAAIDWAGRGIGVVLTRMVSFFVTAGVRAMIEIELFMLTLTVPLWLLPATEDAFYGVLRSLVSLSMAVPAYQFIMLLIDALMGLVLKVMLFGPLAAPGSALSAGAGAVYAASALVAIVGSGGEIVALTVFCYLVAYLFLAVYAAIKTPKIVSLLLKGTGAAAAFLSTFATGLAAGAATALATATVAGGGTAGRLLGAGTWGSPGSPAATTASKPGGAVRSQGHRTVRPAIGRLTSLRPSPSQIFRFGFDTFIAGLGADSPADGCRIVARAVERHQKKTKPPRG
jgi:hypothetical protein